MGYVHFTLNSNFTNSLPIIGANTSAKLIAICGAFRGTVVNISFRNGMYMTRRRITRDKKIEMFSILLANKFFPKPENDSVLVEYDISSSPATIVKKHMLTATS